MTVIKKIMEFSFCVVISAIIFTVWIMLLSYSNNEPIKIEINLIMPLGLGAGWAAYQALFVKMKKIKEEGGLHFWDLLKISIQGTILFVASMFLLNG